MTDELLPQITLTGAGADLDPAAVLSHALMQYQAGVRAEAEARVLAGPIDLGAEILQGILMEVAGGHLNLFRITAGVAFRVSIKHARARQLLTITEIQAAQQADDAAMNLGAYLAATSSNAVMEGYNLNVNAKVPAKEAARRSVHAFGLTTPQMRTVFKLKDDGVSSSRPGAWRSLIDAFINRAFGMRIGALVDNSLRQVEADAIQKGWEDGLANGTISATATKVWVTAADEYTCPTCAPMDGVAVSIMDSFELLDGNRLKAPPVHVNCRCTVELRQEGEEGEEFGKAEHWDPKLHPRAQHGRFGFKPVDEDQAAHDRARETVHRLLVEAGLAVDDLQVGLGTSAPVAAQGLRAAAGPQAAAGLRAGGLAAASSPGVTAPGAAEALRSHAVLGGETVNLARLNMTHQLSVAANLGDIEERQQVELPPREALHPINSRLIAFASPGDMDVDDNLDEGSAQVITPLRFIERNNLRDVRDALDRSMAGMDQWLRSHPVEATLTEAEQASDPGIQEVAAELRTQALSVPRSPKGQLTISMTPEDSMEAWRALLVPRGSGYGAGYRERYTVEIFDETGRTVGATEVTADTAAALTNIGPNHPDLPRIVIAPYGAWRTESGAGATTPGRDGPESLMVTGAFRWKRRNRVIMLTPDAAAYQRANPEN